MSDEKTILKEIESLKFSLRMNELRSFSEYEAYKKDSARLEELKKMLSEKEKNECG